MIRRVHIPLKYKFLSVILFVMIFGFSTFVYFAAKTFTEDKTLFVMDLNLNVLKAALSEVKLDLRGRMEELQVIIPRVYQPSLFADDKAHADDPFRGLTGRLSDEILGITFYKQDTAQKYVVEKQFVNSPLFTKRKINDQILPLINQKYPLSLSGLSGQGDFQLVNRSIRFNGSKGSEDLAVLTILFNGSFVGTEGKGSLIAVDLIQDFLRTRLISSSEITEIFLVNKRGTLLSHSNTTSLVDYAAVPFDHPIVERLQNKQFPRESLELKIGDEAYLCNISETGFQDIFAVSQIKKSKAFEALTMLLQQTAYLALFILSISLIISIVFASRLTSNIRKLQSATQQLGAGNLDVKLDVHSNDEIQTVAESFNWMTKRLGELVQESAMKARMEDELETARLVQSTLLRTPQINLKNAHVVPFYSPATECGGDFWDIFVTGNKLTLIIGDATGHGAPAAIVTAVAKSCFSTLNKIYAGRPLTPEQFLNTLNDIIFGACQGQLLMTMCIVQLDLTTGDLQVCNAGHESPFRVKAKILAQDAKHAVDAIFSRGERLGFSPSQKYVSVKDKLEPGDVVLLFTDGISEAKNAVGKEWGERALKKTLVNSAAPELESLRDGLVAAFKGHVGEVLPDDDVTFVLLKFLQAAPQTKADPEDRNQWVEMQSAKKKSEAA